MNASELIKKLESIVKEHGDMSVIFDNGYDHNVNGCIYDYYHGEQKIVFYE